MDSFVSSLQTQSNCCVSENFYGSWKSFEKKTPFWENLKPFYWEWRNFLSTNSVFIFFSSFQNVEQSKLANIVSLNQATQTMDTNPIKTAITVCSQLIEKKARSFLLFTPKAVTFKGEHRKIKSQNFLRPCNIFPRFYTRILIQYTIWAFSSTWLLLSTCLIYKLSYEEVIDTALLEPGWQPNTHSDLQFWNNIMDVSFDDADFLRIWCFDVHLQTHSV